MQMFVPPTAMHEFAEVQSTALRMVFAPATFGVGGTLHAAEAAEGVSNKAAVANKTRRTDRSDIRPSTYASGQGGSSAAFDEKRLRCGCSGQALIPRRALSVRLTAGAPVALVDHP